MGKDILYPLRRLHGWLHDRPAYLTERRALMVCYIQKVKEYKKNKQPFTFLVLTPEHRNLGDHAIAYCETEMLKQVGVSYIEITGKQLDLLKFYKLLNIMNGYPILINGGGNLGTLWVETEQIQQEIVRKNPKSRIMILPNTIYYENSDWGKDALNRSISIYNAHKYLTFYAREKMSYKFMKPKYKDVRLVPDMVLSWKPVIPDGVRRGCLLCLRKDREKTRTDSIEQTIRDQAAMLFGQNVFDTDTLKEEPVSIGYRAQAVQEKLTEFSHAELVITDRLHGMIFCAITGTPCVTIDSQSPKVRGCYEWIKHLEYIQFVDDADNIAAAYKKIPQKRHVYNNAEILHYYVELTEAVKKHATNQRNRSGL